MFLTTDHGTWRVALVVNGKPQGGVHRIDTTTSPVGMLVPGGNPDGSDLATAYSGPAGSLTCVDCHSPHKIRKAFYAAGTANKDCLTCHGRKDLVAARGASMFVDHTQLEGSRHARIACAQCHTGVTASEMRPCRTVIPKVDCSTCHAEVMQAWQKSTHGQLAANLHGGEFRGDGRAGPGDHDPGGEERLHRRDLPLPRADAGVPAEEQLGLLAGGDVAGARRSTP